MEYTCIPEERFGEVIKHLRDTFFADEPLNKAAGLCQKGEGHHELEELSYATLKDGFSLMAVAQDGEIAGVVLNGVLQPGDMEIAQKKINLSDDENFKKIFNLIYSQNLKFDLFEKFQVDRLFDLRILSVDSKFRGQGIAKELVKRSVAQAECCGFKVLKADATGIFSQKIIRSCGFESLHEVHYAKYTDECGKPILPVEAPHIKLEILFKNLE
ncbi:arylalkylamine N-acetyltransferase 1 [Eupeodes corollae]|uniref:arylalkylamine N-acetyltransferase 1 n=1 Tax=Eupeodes corollae TaxID=290404 RepID=UPI0024923FF3|nr:arylalkylamine N-acetyltransferase 1 [Eupeodes corollae]XP_055923955.1 arylalkylamine N-acetyltransferase 1 [Eupeodes corollae]